MNLRVAAITIAFLLTITAFSPAPAEENHDQQQPGGIWQSRELPAEKPEEHTSDFIILDSGGSGGSFNKGDIRFALHDVHFWNRNIGWTCGYGGVFKTIDGGITWSRIMPRGSWMQIEMTGAQEIWLLEGIHPGGIGKVHLLHSTDDGKTWDEVCSDTFSHYWDMKFCPHDYWLLDSNYAWHSENGLDWQQTSFDGIRFKPYKISIPGDICAENGYIIYMLGTKDKMRCLMKSDDSGQSWMEIEGIFKVNANFRHELYFATSKLGWIGAEDGKVWRTENGGFSWNECPLPRENYVTALWFDQLGRGYAGVFNSKMTERQSALFATPDGGRNWSVALTGAKQISSFYSLAPHLLWGVGNVPDYVRNDLILIRKRTH